MFGWLKNLTGTRVDVKGSATFPSVDRIETLNLHGGTVEMGRPWPDASITNTAGDFKVEYKPAPKVERERCFAVRGEGVYLSCTGNALTIHQGELYANPKSICITIDGLDELISLLQAAKREVEDDG